MEPRDRAAGHRLAAAVLRRSGTLDAVLEPLMRKAPPDPVRNVLRIGAAGLLLLEMPPHAAVGTAVALARTVGLAPFAGLVNAVLRKVAAGGVGGAGDTGLAAAGYTVLAVGVVGRRREGHRRGAPARGAVGSDARRRGDRTAAGDAGSAIRCRPGRCAIRPERMSLTIPGFAEGKLWVQDAAAALPAMLLAPRPGGTDRRSVCGAPGGKTAQLAAAGAHVTAVERDPARLARLAENLARWRLDRGAYPGGCGESGPRPSCSMRSCSTRRARRPERSAAIRMFRI